MALDGISPVLMLGNIPIYLNESIGLILSNVSKSVSNTVDNGKVARGDVTYNLVIQSGIIPVAPQLDPTGALAGNLTPSILTGVLPLIEKYIEQATVSAEETEGNPEGAISEEDKEKIKPSWSDPTATANNAISLISLEATFFNAYVQSYSITFNKNTSLVNINISCVVLNITQKSGGVLTTANIGTRAS